MANEKRLKTCGDCIHADICQQVNYGGWFSRENPAYCKAFKDKNSLVKVVRCNDCKYSNHCSIELELAEYWMPLSEHFCSYGERKTGG